MVGNIGLGGFGAEEKVTPEETPRLRPIVDGGQADVGDVGGVGSFRPFTLPSSLLAIGRCQAFFTCWQKLSWGDHPRF